MSAARQEYYADRKTEQQDAEAARAEAANKARLAFEAEQKAMEEEANKLSNRLSKIKLTLEQNYGQDLAAFESYLKQRVDLENLTGEERVEAVKAQEALILARVKLTEEEKRALTAASAELQEQALTKETEELIKAAEEIGNARKKQYGDFVKMQEDKENTSKERLRR